MLRCKLVSCFLCVPMSRLTYMVSYAGIRVVKLFPCSIQLIMPFILLINVKMPTVVGILTFISRMDIVFESFKAGQILVFQHFSFSDQFKFPAQLS